MIGARCHAASRGAPASSWRSGILAARVPATTGRRALGRCSGCRPQPSGRCSPATAPHACRATPPRGDPLRAGTPGGAAARRHQAAGPLLAGRQAILQDGFQRTPRAGWHHPHVAIDDHSRLVVCELFAGHAANHSIAFLKLAIAWFATEHAISIERVLTDNGYGYRSHLARHLPAAGHRPPAHPPLHAPHQRQSRGLHPHRPQRNGPTPSPTTPAPTAPAPSTAGCAGTTADDPTAPSATARHQPRRTGPGSVHLGFSRSGRGGRGRRRRRCRRRRRGGGPRGGPGSR